MSPQKLYQMGAWGPQAPKKSSFHLPFGGYAAGQRVEENIVRGYRPSHSPFSDSLSAQL